jgi:hypothetical protein
MRHPMLRRIILSSAAAAILLAATPAAANVFTITLENGTTFESRYQPQEASYDASKILFLNSLGLPMALPKDMVESVTSEAETSGFGKVIDTTTIDLGYLPNDLPTEEELAEAQRQGLGLAPGQAVPVYNMEQFVEPGELGGMPVWGAGGGGAGFQSPLPTTPVPFTPPPQVGAPVSPQPPIPAAPGQ